MATTSSVLDISSIVSQLMAVERRPLTKLAAREAGYQARLSAYGSVKGAVSSFQAALQALNSPSKFQSVTATASDSAVFSASATSTAVPGTYSIEVATLAQPQKLVAAGQASSSAAIGGGTATTVTFDFGTISGGTLANGVYSGASFVSNGDGTKSITIDSSNNSLLGIRDAINAAKIGVAATIVNDGSGSPYRLALAADHNGVDQSLKISVSGDAAIDSLLAHDPGGVQNLTETAAAQNANLKINGVTVTKTSNTISDAVEGVTLNLNKVTSSPASLTVARDTNSIKASINSFVKAYNELSGTLKNVSAYDAAAKKGAILQGDATVRSLQTQLRAMIGAPVEGAPGDLKTLASIGITFQKDGTLGVDQGKLSTAIADHFDEIASLFTTVGSSTDSLVSFSSGTRSTKAGSYALDVTQVATQGKTVGKTISVPLVIAAGSNDTLNLSIDGVGASVELSPGTYTTAGALAAELQTKINGAAALSGAGVSVAVSESAGKLTITSVKYGSGSTVLISGGTAEVSLGLDGDAPSDGVDVAGTIAGVTASGSGQVLTASSGEATGLAIVVNGGTLGSRGRLHYSQGYAATLNSWASAVLDSDSIISARTDGIDRSIKDVAKRRSEFEARLVNMEKRYRAQFVALDSMLASMNNTSNYLTQQLANLPGNQKS
ncbi:flagellar hook-associated protein 2 [Thiobacillus denitrificans ATCC 25259]|uniref:Flagellar hook-associated protein 2 n=1 Tax=Thiobacillus denitrificans (strain ATCC 25259 / T1) TaxID=292415 RepID=Q3SII3_THIDA|nr:flagellar filament capping protein FliD [Thiobacillus denitrificans]AAZ97545.1 flagellar hook-associated protein 2 [Thiobacillus denitrificans ATCC 25259]